MSPAPFRFRSGADAMVVSLFDIGICLGNVAVEYRDTPVSVSDDDQNLRPAPAARHTGNERDNPSRDGVLSTGENPSPRGLQQPRLHRSHRHHGQSSSGGSRLDKQRRQTIIARVIAGAALSACVALSVMLISARAQLATRNFDAGTLASTLKRTQSELTQTKQLVAAQEVELGALLKQRIPGVATMETEKLHDINKGYAKKLMFSEAGAGDEKHITYNIVLKNTGDRPIIPAVSILLFDRKGLQTGLAEVSPAAATIPNQSERIEPGETRAYSGLVQRIRSDPPAYYLVEVK